MDGLRRGSQLIWKTCNYLWTVERQEATPWSTSRREGVSRILSGLYNGKTTGTPLAMVIENTDTRSKDYSELTIKPRPGHGDLTGIMRYDGANDPRGGGHFSDV